MDLGSGIPVPVSAILYHILVERLLCVRNYSRPWGRSIEPDGRPLTSQSLCSVVMTDVPQDAKK